MREASADSVAVEADTAFELADMAGRLELGMVTVGGSGLDWGSSEDSRRCFAGLHATF